ncbi:MAG: biotin carboxylase, partial [Spirochaetia bacterium]|nr:biotin carboxylase [Spirochaetia bacterium]
METRQDKYKKHPSQWVQGFSCSHLKILIVCRGPIRKEAMDVFAGIGADFGILLSEKDSVVYPATLAPELRVMKDQSRIHRVPDYTGASGEERKSRIAQIVHIAASNGYTHIFAGYGFMAEDAEFVEAIEKGGVGFIGPASVVHKAAGAKDQAKKLARKINVSVTPGIDNVTALTLLSKTGGIDGAKKLASDKGLTLPAGSDKLEPELLAEAILDAGYAKGIGLITTSELQKEARKQLEKLFKENPGRRFRLKYIGGGGGKGQRIVSKPEEVEDAAIQVLQESKAMGDADNKNFLIELNIERTRHNEIQLIGNGEWCLALGGRDCSLQMHEQKLVEISITDELFSEEIARAERDGRYADTLKADKKMLADMERQAEEFGRAVHLNSASTFECIVTGDSFYFMEMNTRIQVEHRVTEMVYSLRFENPADKKDSFVVESLVEAMVLCAAHAPRLPKPTRVVRYHAGGEVRLNAMNDALAPHAGGVIEHWSTPAEHEIRDDQGIGLRNPDTGWFIKYHVAGAYDSNIALIVTYGDGRRQMLERLADILRRTELRGVELSTNRDFHYGILNFCLGLHPMLKPDTRFVVPYLTAVGSLAEALDTADVHMAWDMLRRRVSETQVEAEEALSSKYTLITRALGALMANPHIAMGWLVLNRGRAFSLEEGRVRWKRNPLRVLADLYTFLRLEEREAPPAQRIWDHDADLLKRGLEFYADLDKALGRDTDAAFADSVTNCRENTSTEYLDLDRALSSAKVTPELQKAVPADVLGRVCNAHRAWQTGLSLLELPIILGQEAGIFEFSVNDHLEPVAPERFLKADAQKASLKKLAPPPAASADQIVAVTGGMFYAKETPASPPFLEVGSHFNPGDALYIIEVMKMFNRI